MKTYSLSALILILLMVPLGPLAIDIYLPSIPIMMVFFQASSADLQATITLYMVFFGIGQLLAGPISDKWGRKHSAIICLSLYALGSLAVALSTSLPMLYIARAIQGLGGAFGMVTTLAWVRDHFDGQQAGKWLSYMSGIAGATPMIAPMLGGLLASVWGWSAGFYAMSILSLLLLFSAIFSLSSIKPSYQGIDLKDKKQLRCHIKDIFKHRQFQTYNLVTVLSFAMLLTYISVAPIVAVKKAGMGEIEFASLLAVIGFCQFVFSFLAPKIVSILGQANTVLLGLVTSIFAGAGMLLIASHTLTTFFTMAAIGTTGFSILIGTSTALTLEPFKYCAGLASSLGGFMRMLGGAIVAFGMTKLDITSEQALAFALLLLIIPLYWVLADSKKGSHNQINAKTN